MFGYKKRRNKRKPGSDLDHQNAVKVMILENVPVENNVTTNYNNWTIDAAVDGGTDEKLEFKERRASRIARNGTKILSILRLWKTSSKLMETNLRLILNTVDHVQVAMRANTYRLDPTGRTYP